VRGGIEMFVVAAAESTRIILIGMRKAMRLAGKRLAERIDNDGGQTGEYHHHGVNIDIN
jgi:hypothetical protein